MHITNIIIKNKFYVIAAALLYLIIRSIIDIYLIYNVAKMQSSASCECASGWELYAIYIQTVLACIDVIGSIIIVFIATESILTN